MDKMQLLKDELEGRVAWLDQRLTTKDNWSEQMLAYLLARRRTYELVIERIDELTR